MDGVAMLVLVGLGGVLLMLKTTLFDDQVNRSKAIKTEPQRLHDGCRAWTRSWQKDNTLVRCGAHLFEDQTWCSTHRTEEIRAKHEAVGEGWAREERTRYVERKRQESREGLKIGMAILGGIAAFIALGIATGSD